MRGVRNQYYILPRDQIRVKDKERSNMYDMENRGYEFSREKALREEIMAGRDKFFMQSSLKGAQIEEHEKLLRSLFHFNRG